MGQGLEGALPDGKLGRILDNAFYPSASTGKLDRAFQATYSEVFRAVAQEYNWNGDMPAQTNEEEDMPTWLIILIIIIVLIFIRSFRKVAEVLVLEAMAVILVVLVEDRVEEALVDLVVDLLLVAEQAGNFNRGSGELICLVRFHYGLNNSLSIIDNNARIGII